MRAILFILTAASLLFGAYTRDSALETVYDDQTNLTWQDDANASSVTRNWQGAIDYCEALDFAGVDDWRLPNINELLSITDLTAVNPAIDTAAFQNVLSYHYWSSTTYAGDTTGAWNVYFYNGADNISNKTVSTYVRCVRGGQIVPSATQAVSVPLSDGAKAALALLFALGAFVMMRRRSAV